MTDSHIICNYEDIFHKVSIISNTSLSTLNKILYTNVAKFPALTSEHILRTVTVQCHLQDIIHIVHLLQGQTGGSQRVPDLGCEQDGEEQSIPFF
jgi:hypothetical protein